MQNVIHCRYKFPKFPQVSEECRDLLRRMPVADPNKRINMVEIKKHPFFSSGLPDGALGMNDCLLRNRPSSDPQCWQQYKTRIQALVHEATRLPG